jgi:hypothetical protein
MKEITTDLLFSGWIFYWIIIYYLLTILNNSYSRAIKLYFNPLLAIIIASIFSLVEFIDIIIKNPKFNIIWKYTIILLFKLFIIYLLMRDNIKINFINIFILIIIYGAYNLYLYTKNTNIIEIYNKEHNAVITGKNITPFFHFIATHFSKNKDNI